MGFGLGEPFAAVLVAADGEGPVGMPDDGVGDAVDDLHAQEADQIVVVRIVDEEKGLGLEIDGGAQGGVVAREAVPHLRQLEVIVDDADAAVAEVPGQVVVEEFDGNVEDKAFGQACRGAVAVERLVQNPDRQRALPLIVRGRRGRTSGQHAKRQEQEQTARQSGHGCGVLSGGSCAGR